MDTPRAEREMAPPRRCPATLDSSRSRLALKPSGQAQFSLYLRIVRRATCCWFGVLSRIVQVGGVPGPGAGTPLIGRFQPDAVFGRHWAFPPNGSIH